MALTFTELRGPVEANSAFSSNSTSNYISDTRWKNHIYSVSDSFAEPVKIYKDSVGNWQVNTAGLPSIELEGAIDLANDLKAKYNAHAADGTEHSTAPDAVNVISSDDAVSEATLYVLVSEIITRYSAHEADAALAAAWLYHAAQEAATHVLASTTTATQTTFQKCLAALDDLKIKYNAHDNDATAHGTQSLHQSSYSRNISVTGSAGTQNFLYKFLYKHTYMVGDVEFEVLGATTEVEALLLTSGTKSITNIPAISNGSLLCYATDVITVEIYRTENDGTVFYFIGRVTNGTTTFSDTVSDATLVDNPTIYTNGGALDHDTPPPAKFIHVVNNVALFGYVQEGAIAYPTRFRMSIPGSPDHCPGSLGDDIEVPITAVNSVGLYWILCGRDRTYRIEGLFDELGRGTVQAREISRTKGCISNNSMVQIPNGLVFAGIDQFYFTDGYNVKPIDTHHVESYKELIANPLFEKKISGRYDSAENRVYWVVCDNTTTAENNKMWVLDLNFPNALTAESPFTKFSNTTSWRPTDIEFFVNTSNVRTFVIADSRGYLFKFDSNTFTDPDSDSGGAASTWATNQVIYDYKSFATNFGTVKNFKFVPTTTLQAKNVGDVTIQVNSNNEDSGLFIPLKEIRKRGGITWGDPNVYWNYGTVEYLWNVNSLIRELRRFPAGNLRTVYKQIQITNAYTNIFNSDTLGIGNVDATLKTFTLTGVGQEYPSEIVNYYISFADDNYTNDFQISARNSTTVLTYSDPSNLTTTTTGSKWLIKGYRKGEQLSLLSYTLDYAVVGENQTVYRGETGGNA